ncbi:FIG00773777: hypothetical protein [Leuconostoc inhae]|nr:FIG00773777: hypothetical protein [Leuconostoc inhae]
MPVFIDSRVAGLLTITTIIDVAIIFIFQLYQIQNGRLTFGFALLVISLFTVYKLDKVLKIDELPFETTLKYAVLHYWRYWFQKKQLYQDQHLNSNQKKYQIL